MEFYTFDKEVGKNITHFNSNFIMSKIIKTDKHSQIGCMHLDANGIVVSPGSGSPTSPRCKWRRLG